MLPNICQTSTEKRPGWKAEYSNFQQRIIK